MSFGHEYILLTRKCRRCAKDRKYITNVAFFDLFICVSLELQEKIDASMCSLIVPGIITNHSLKNISINYFRQDYNLLFSSRTLFRSVFLIRMVKPKRPSKRVPLARKYNVQKKVRHLACQVIGIIYLTLSKLFLFS